ncbi:conserved hypothetical protein [uncultured delta proteobacterium]|uniref:PPC domain-containing protein n=1 Tax=uncultured delta proteobacterium TaxID=34034 RepID=A0A212JMF4_9DELT|nr:conserved hypothetical protein [uncultured delta proteobacterium]
MDIRVSYAKASNGTVLGRVHPGSDVIKGIEKICAECGIKNGWVDCIGSLRETKYFILTKQPQTKAGAGYGAPIAVAGPVELIAAQGLLVNGSVHLHGIMCDDQGRTFGGHIIAEGSPVLVTCEVSIADSPGLSCARGDDGEVDGMQFFPKGL